MLDINDPIQVANFLCDTHNAYMSTKDYAIAGHDLPIDFVGEFCLISVCRHGECGVRVWVEIYRVDSLDLYEYGELDLENMKVVGAFVGDLESYGAVVEFRDKIREKYVTKPIKK